MILNRRKLLAGIATAPWPTLVQAGGVAADGFDEFWWWAGVKPQPVLATARTLYVLQAEVRAARRAGAAPVWVMQTPGLSGTYRDRPMWLVFRVETLQWPSAFFDAVLARTRFAVLRGFKVLGVQIDFDAQTRHLNRYVDFLMTLRQALPPAFKLSITGLMDWSANGDPTHLQALNGVVDELVIQTYQGRRTITGYEGYFDRIRRLGVPFKVGLVQGGEWTAPAWLEGSAQFRGYVVFLVNGG